MSAGTERFVGDRYEVVRELWASGGVRTVEATHRHTARRALLRVATDASALLLARDAKLLAAVRHPNVMDVTDAGPTEDGGFFLAFEPNDGRSLEGLLAARGALPLEAVVGIGVAVGEALLRLAASPLERLPPSVGDVFLALVGGREVVKLVVETRTGSMRPPSHGAPVVAGADARALANLVLLALGAPVDVPVGAFLERAAKDAPPRLVAALRAALGASGASAPAVLDELVHALQEARGGAGTTALLRPPLPAAQSELRRTERAEYVTPVALKVAGAVVEARSEDLSEGGMLVVTSARIEADVELSARFALPIDGRLVELRAKVAWRKDGRPGPAGPTTALGLSFVDAPKDALAAVARYVELMKR